MKASGPLLCICELSRLLDSIKLELPCRVLGLCEALIKILDELWLCWIRYWLWFWMVWLWLSDRIGGLHRNTQSEIFMSFCQCFCNIWLLWRAFLCEEVSPSSGFTICSFSGKYDLVVKAYPDQTLPREGCEHSENRLSVGVPGPPLLLPPPFSSSLAK